MVIFIYSRLRRQAWGCLCNVESWQQVIVPTLSNEVKSASPSSSPSQILFAGRCVLVSHGPHVGSSDHWVTEEVTKEIPQSDDTRALAADKRAADPASQRWITPQTHHTHTTNTTTHTWQKCLHSSKLEMCEQARGFVLSPAANLTDLSRRPVRPVSWSNPAFWNSHKEAEKHTPACARGRQE